jgi:hypothetical protein
MTRPEVLCVFRSALPLSRIMSGRTFRTCLAPCLLFFCAASHAQATATLRGTVIDSQTHRGIARALVSLEGGRPGQLTDDDGHFTFANVAAGPVQVRCRRPGYFDPLTGSRDASFTLTATDSGPEENTDSSSSQTLPLEPAATVRGRVSVPEGDSPSGVRVDLYAAHVVDGWRRWQVEHSTNVRANGAFSFGNLEPGSYAVHAQGSVDPVPFGTPTGVRSGYGPVFAPSAADLASATIAVLQPGQTAELDPELARVAYYPVKIHVADEYAGFSARITGNGFTRWSAGYSREDQALTTELPSGSYVAHIGGFSRFGAVSLGGFPRGRSSRGDLSFQVHDAPATNLSMTLNAATPITLQTQVQADTGDASAADQSGTAAAAPRLILLTFVRADVPDEEPQTAFVPNDSSGGDQPLQANLGAGAYWVSATTSGGYAVSLSSGGTDLFTQPLSVDTGSPPTISAVLSPDTASVTVTVGEQLQGKPCVVQLVPMSPGGRAESRAVHGDEATVQLSGLAPGDYLVFASPIHGNMAYREPGGLQQLTGEHVSVAAGATGQVTLNTLFTPPTGAMEPR